MSSPPITGLDDGGSGVDDDNVAEPVVVLGIKSNGFCCDGIYLDGETSGVF